MMVSRLFVSANNFKIRILFIVLLGLANFNSYGQDWGFAKSYVGNGQDMANDIAVDHLGNIFITGSFSDTIFFGSDTLINIGGWDIFIAKFDPLGNAVWARKAGHNNMDFNEAYDIVIDDNNNCYVSGRYRDTIHFDTITAIAGSNSSWNGFIAKYDNNGSIQWVENLTSSNYILIRDLEVNNNKLLVTGYFYGSATIDGYSINSSTEDFYFAEFDTSGNATIVVQNNSPSSEAGRAIAVDGFGNINIAGNFSDTAFIFNDTLIATSNGFNTFIAQYDNLGNYLWSEQITGSWTQSTDIKIDTNNNIIVSGSFEGDANFQNDTLIGFSSDVYLAKYSNGGQFIWAKNLGDHGYNCREIVLDCESNIYLSGDFQNDAFLKKYDSNGSLIWTDVAISNSVSRVLGISADSNGNLYLTGMFLQDFELGGFDFSSASSDIFIFKLTSAKFASIAPLSLSESINIEVYPNPSNGNISITSTDFNQHGFFKVTLYNIQGQQFIDIEKYQLNQKINFEQLPKGVYFLTIGNNSVKVTKKVIKN